MNPLTWIGVACFVALGVMFVLLTWALEAASSCYRKESDKIWRAKKGAMLKPHLISLLSYVPIDLNGCGHDAYTADEDGSGHRILEKRGRVWAPWNLALWVSAGLGGVLGVGLAHAPSGYVASVTAISVSLVAGGLLAYCDSQLARLGVSGITAIILVGVTNGFHHLPIGILAAGPWLTITALYLMFRGSSYRDLKEFGSNVLEAISSTRIVFKLGPLLLHVVIGDAAWLAAGFASTRKQLVSDHSGMIPHQAKSTILISGNTAGRTDGSNQESPEACREHGQSDGVT